ncbi:MAG TPA: hypothetical protein VFS99_08140, partial [Xanthomonadaceae bacterium]|nr:hypothetical protein [Xanthomonadaceae bacterium]
GSERIPFLRADVLVLPITNVTVEELAAYLLARLATDARTLAGHGIHVIEMEVASGPGQGATMRWDADRHGG